MSQHKTYTFRPPLYRGHESATTRARNEKDSERTPLSEQQGWDAYRKWLSKVSTRPMRDRSKVDHSIYTWKGYNNWADKIKRNWVPEEEPES